MSTAGNVADEAITAHEPRFVAPGLVEVTDDGPRLAAGRCRSCGAVSFPKAPVCTGCLSLEIEPAYLARDGVLYSFAIVHQAPKGWSVPYALGYVDLADGIRVLAHIGGEPSGMAIGQPVRLATGQVGTAADGAPLSSYVFVPVAAQAGPSPGKQPNSNGKVAS